MSRRVLVPCLAVFACAWSLSAFAVDSPLEGIPETAAVLVRLKSPDATVKKVADFASLIKPEYGASVTGAAGALGVVISNPSFTGVDRSKDWWLIVFGEAGAAPKIAYAIAASDAKMMKQALGDEFKSATFDNWVFYSKSEEALSQFEARKSGKLKSASTALDAHSRAVFDKSDLGAFVNVRQVRTVYKKELETAKQQAHAFIEQMGRLLSQSPQQGINMTAMVAVYSQLADLAFQIVDDTETVAAGLVVAEKEVDVEGSAVVSPSSPSDRFLARNTPAEMKPLGRLPAEKPVYFGLAGDISGMMELGAKFGGSMFKDNKQYEKAVTEAVKAYKEMKLGSICGIFSLGNPTEGVLNFAVVNEVDTPEKMRDVLLHSWAAMSSIQMAKMKQTVTVKRDAEKVGGHQIDILATRQEFEPGGDPTGAGAAMMKIMYGPQGMTMRFTTLPGLVAYAIGGGKEPMADLIQSVDGKETAAARPAWTLARAKLPARANLILLVDLPHLVTDVMRVMTDLHAPGVPFNDGDVAELQKDLSASYTGVAVVTEPHAVVKHVRIPLEQAKGIAAIVEFIVSKVRGH